MTRFAFIWVIEDIKTTKSLLFNILLCQMDSSFQFVKYYVQIDHRFQKIDIVRLLKNWKKLLGSLIGNGQCAQCGNCRNSLSHFFRKNFVKAIVLPMKLLKCWFEDIFSVRENFTFFHTVLLSLSFEKYFVKSTGFTKEI